MRGKGGSVDHEGDLKADQAKPLDQKKRSVNFKLEKTHKVVLSYSWQISGLTSTTKKNILLYNPETKASFLNFENKRRKRCFLEVEAILFKSVRI